MIKKLEFVQTQERGHWVGDGFPVRSIFSYHEQTSAFSPFLLLDYAGPMHFGPVTGSTRRGVGEHPHRGFETVTIVYAGEVEHRDSTGAGGVIGPGDVQWMTAGGGIVHEEFHGPAFSRTGGPFEVVQLWVNLPARHKMVPPAYQSILDAEIPRVEPAAGVAVRVIAGTCGNATGPAHTYTPMNLWDVRLAAGARADFVLPAGHTCAVFVLRGRIRVDSAEVGPATVAVMSRQEERLILDALEDTVLLILDGEPIDEPVVGYGPFVMNTEDEIRQAMADYQYGRMGRILRSAREVETV
jgi:redox-sensitive bicupin YhaK (pirin superfamily)